LPVYLAMEGEEITYRKMTVGEEEDLPSLCYVVTKKGVMLYKDTFFATSFVDIPDQDKTIAEFTPVIQYGYPEIDYKTYRIILTFFREVYKKHKSEAMVLLAIKKDGDKYRLLVPKQYVSSAGIRYDCTEIYNNLKKNEILCGSVHSHPTFAASQSSIDKADEENPICDGLHITFGNINKDIPDIHTRFVASGKTLVSKNPMVQTQPPTQETKIPQDWMNKVSENTPTKTTHTWTSSGRSGGSVITENKNTEDHLDAWGLMLTVSCPNEKSNKIVSPIDWERHTVYVG